MRMIRVLTIDLQQDNDNRIEKRIRKREKMATIYLGGPSANPNWHIPRALHSLEGEIEAAKKVIEMWEPYLNHRIAGNKEHTNELGIATVAIMLTSVIVERAIKTLIAQTQPDVKPEHTHKLLVLFKKLHPSVQQEVQSQFETLPVAWQRYSDDISIEKVLRIADASFVDWRYTMEPRATTGGIPKPVLKAAIAFKIVCWTHLQAWQASP